MTGLEALQAVQYITAKGKRLAVLDLEDWEALLEWLEGVEDAQIVREAYEQLQAAKGDRQGAGWLRWDDVKAALNRHPRDSQAPPL